MGIPVLILGRSGSGKSRSIKNLDCGVIKVTDEIIGLLDIRVAPNE